MDQQLAFVLSGGGSRGALQVGALYALYEHGYAPDLVVGTSVGAVNAAFLALHGFSTASLDRLSELWKTGSTFNLLPTNYMSMALRKMLGRQTASPSDRIREFITTSGLAPDLCFSHLPGPHLVIVSSDLSTGRPVLHGLDPDEKVLDALMLSTALPPWMLPVKRQGAYIMDGGIVSNLPVEAALQSGATRIVALDLFSHDLLGETHGLRGFFTSLVFAAERRESDLELALARAQGVPVLYIAFSAKYSVPLWDFSQTAELLEQGYETACRILAEERFSA